MTTPTLTKQYAEQCTGNVLTPGLHSISLLVNSIQ